MVYHTYEQDQSWYCVSYMDEFYNDWSSWLLIDFVTFCLRYLRDKVQTPNTKKLPHDIIIDILTRLPAKYVVNRLPLPSLTTFPSFIATHFKRAAPIIVFCYRFGKPVVGGPCLEHCINFTDVMGKKTTTSMETFSADHTFISGLCKAVFYGSCWGFLIFVSELRYVHIWNPVTKQKLSIKPCARRWGDYFHFCGFYFHQPNMSYRLLFRDLKMENVPVSFTFCVYDYASGTDRRLATQVHHPPSIQTQPTMVNQALHWMVSDEAYKKIYGGRSDCLHSIISFDVNNEQICTMQHPGDQCGLIPKHENMGLMNIEGKLAFCDASSNKNLVIWGLEDYQHRLWVMRHVIEIEPLMRFCALTNSNCSYAYVGDFHMFNKELLLRVGNSEFVLYNLESGTSQRVGTSVRKSRENDLIGLAVPHIHTMFKITGIKVPDQSKTISNGMPLTHFII